MSMRKLLLLPAFLFHIVTGFRNRLFKAGILREKTFATPVISIGNLTLGGTGKTPHVELLIRLLKDEFKIATLSRGYGRKTSGFREVTLTSSTEECGDEPVQYKNKFPDINVFVCESRREGIRKIEQYSPDVILLDDAYQHRYVKPSLNMLLTEFDAAFFNDHIFPYGRLRESAKGYDRADIIMVTKCPDELTEMEMDAFTAAVHPLPHQKIFFSRLKYHPLQKFSNSSVISQEAYKTTHVLMVTGIANPLPARRYLEKHFASVQPLVFPDHHHFTSADYSTIAQKFDNIVSPAIIVTTEKDAVRMQGNHTDLPVYILPVEIELVSDKLQFEQYITDHVRKNKANS
jgi:tetraacyldisaccharide 4'-kinase